MDINFICTEKRRNFGKPCAFVDIDRVLLCEIDSNPTKKDEYVKISTVDRQIDNSVKMCGPEVNTLRFSTENRGMNHKEGGWPINVDNQDEESMARFRKKIEKDKSYVNSVKSLSQLMENSLMENTSINIYQEYFEDEKIKRDTKWSFSVKSMFPDLNEPFRSVVDMSWRKDATKFAAVYSGRKNQNHNMPCLNSYVWDVENNVKPSYVLQPELPMTVIEFSHSNLNLILGGHISGQVALWDIRTVGNSQQSSPVIGSHRNKVTGIKWLKCKHDTEFFSGSSDGTLLFWDCRNLSAPIESIHLDCRKDHISNLENDFPISCVEYEATLPDNFIIGSDQGSILSFNRKCKQNKDRFHSVYDCQSRPIINVERNAFFPQLFLSCDAWSLKMWSDSVTDSSILNMVSRKGYYTDATWSPTRASTIYATKSTGFLEIWDLPGKYKEPLLNIRLDKESLLKVDVAESGSHVLCGTLSGSIQLLTIPDHLKISSETEKELLSRCIKGSEKVIGGNMRSERISEERELGSNEESRDSPEKEKDLYDTERELGSNVELWDPPEKAEDLHDTERELGSNKELPDPPEKADLYDTEIELWSSKELLNPPEKGEDLYDAEEELGTNGKSPHPLEKTEDLYDTDRELGSNEKSRDPHEKTEDLHETEGKLESKEELRDPPEKVEDLYDTEGELGTNDKSQDPPDNFDDLYNTEKELESNEESWDPYEKTEDLYDTENDKKDPFKDDNSTEI